jgi:hypothetical protein
MYKLICIIILILLIIYFNIILNNKNKESMISLESLHNISSLYKTNNFLNINGNINNLTSSDISANNINILKLNVKNMNTNKLCVDVSQNTCINNSIVSNLIIKVNLETSRLNQYMYLPDESSLTTVNDCSSLTISKIGSGKILSALNTSFKPDYMVTKWPSNDVNGKYIYTTATGNTIQPNGTGIKITVPQPPQGSTYEYEVLWVQTRNLPYTVSRRSTIIYFYKANFTRTTFKVYQMIDNKIQEFGKYITINTGNDTGGNLLNNISPDGGIHNERWNQFEWHPVPINLKNSREIIISNFEITDTWFSGFAFSSNPWKHYKINIYSLLTNDIQYANFSPIEYVSASRIPTSYDTYAYFLSNTTPVISIPFVNSGRDKIFYIVENNINQGSGMINISIGNTVIGNLYTSFDNPFARHYNSKVNQKYLAIIIPKNLTVGLNILTIKLNIPLIANNFCFREMGTHDVNPFQV